MAKNSIPRQLDQLFPMAKNLVEGLQAHGESAGVLHHTAPKMNADLTAARTAENLYQAARSKRLGMSPALAAARKEGKTFLTTAKNVLRPWLGQRWNTRWAETGFVSQSQSSPTKNDEKEEILKILAAYFTANPKHESAQHGVTAARATELYEAITAAAQAARFQDAEISRLKVDRDATVKQLKTRMRGLINELKDLLPALDSRWTAFGLNAPGASSRPAANQADDTDADTALELALPSGATGYLDESDSSNGHRISTASPETAVLVR